MEKRAPKMVIKEIKAAAHEGIVHFPKWIFLRHLIKGLEIIARTAAISMYDRTDLKYQNRKIITAATTAIIIYLANLFIVSFFTPQK